jgi:hypothetical protein
VDVAHIEPHATSRAEDVAEKKLSLYPAIIATMIKEYRKRSL